MRLQSRAFSRYLAGQFTWAEIVGLLGEFGLDEGIAIRNKEKSLIQFFDSLSSRDNAAVLKSFTKILSDLVRRIEEAQPLKKHELNDWLIELQASLSEIHLKFFEYRLVDTSTQPIDSGATSHVDPSQQLIGYKATAQKYRQATGIHVVLLVHGINTRGRWIHVIGPALEQAGFTPAPAGYGVFGILRFLLPVEFVRRHAIEKVRRGLRLAKEVHKPEKLSVIAHSFGSFIVARLLMSEFDVQWHRIIFCGSVNNAELEVEQVLRRFTPPMLNDVGGRDYFPAIAERATRTFGSVGSYGFLNAAVRDRFHRNKKHSDFLNKEFCKKWWIPFLKTGFIEEGDEWEDFPRMARLLLWMPWRVIIYAMLLATIYGTAVLGRWLLVDEIPYSYSQTVSSARSYVDLGAAISATVSDIEANCRRSSLDRWLHRQQCVSARSPSEVMALRACRSFSIRARTPEEALKSLVVRFDDCFRVIDDGEIISVSIQADQVVRVTVRQGTWFMCACSPDQIQSLEFEPR